MNDLLIFEGKALGALFIVAIILFLYNLRPRKK